MVNDESKLQVDKKRDKQERKILDTQVGFTSNLKIIFLGAILSWNKLDQRSSFLGRFWVPNDWSNIILSWRTSFRNVHSGMSTALHRANWVQQNLTSRKCSSTLLIYFDASLIIILKVMCNDENDTRYRLNHVFGLCEDPSSMPREEELASRYSLSLVLVLVFS